MTRDSKYIIIVSKDNTIGVWSIADKTLLHRFEEAYSGWIASVVAVTSDNKKIISGSGAVWSMADKTLFHRFTDSIRTTLVVVTSDNKYIISGFDGMSIGIWSIEDKLLFHRFEEAHSKVFTSIAVASNNKYIILGSFDWAIKVWSIAEKKLLLQSKEQERIGSVAVTSDSKYSMAIKYKTFYPIY